jgi:GR25 family glycosyltransferase involved in LPS biosynthesis
MDYFKHTLFINLTERTDRLFHIENELKKMNITGERVNAIKLKNGALGCTMSHIACLEIAKNRNYPHVFICEDDIQFLNPSVFFDSLQKFEKSEYASKFDVLIVGGNNCPPYENKEEYCLRVFNCQTTTGYIVREHYYDTLISNFKESAKNLLMNPHNIREYALDIYWKRLQYSGYWFMIIPATVVQYESYSDIEKHVVNYKNLMTDIDKGIFLQRIQEQNKQNVLNNKNPKPVFSDMFYCNKANN